MFKISKSEVFNTELNFIENEDIKKFCEEMLEKAPDYFYSIPASSTGKYHPNYALGDGGLVRHTKALVNIMNYILGLEWMQEKYDSRKRDLMRVAGLLHDTMKDGDGTTKYTVHEHPLLAAAWVEEETVENEIPQEERSAIAAMIETHMGQWSTNKKSNIELPKPQHEVQFIVHLSDYLASRKQLEFVFSEEDAIPVKIEEYELPFGKYKGFKLIEMFEKDKDYFIWLKNNCSLREPLSSFINNLLKE